MESRVQAALVELLAALTGAGQSAGAAPAPASSALPAWMSTAEYASYIRVSPRTVAEWAQRAPSALAVKYGRVWRVAGPAFDAWVRAGGPYRNHEDDSREQVH